MTERKYYNLFNKQTRKIEFAGWFKPEDATGNYSYFVQEVYELPIYEPDGWYLVEYGATQSFRRKEGNMGYDKEGQPQSPWNEYRVIAEMSNLTWR